MKNVLALFSAVWAVSLAAGEPHVDGVVREILVNVSKVKAAAPDAVPMAFWDFDGTVIRGDISTGYELDGRKVYSGMLAKAAEKGFSTVFRSAADAEEFLAGDYPRLSEKYGRWLSWPLFGQVFSGADAEKLERFCRDYADSALKRWYFESSLAIMRALEKAGVENYVVSGSYDIFVKAASVAAGVPRSRALGIRQRIAGGRITTQLEYPLPMNEGKVECVREVLNARPGAVAVAAFGNSYWTDGPFMRYVAVNPLPGGAKATALMINGGTPPPEYAGLFRLAEQAETGAGK
jgi:phosphoserine phosphatase